MRVIAGKCKGLRLKSLPGDNTRPTSDKVKEALFHRLGPFFDGGKGLDLYGGSGGISIEAISRGFHHMHVADAHKGAISVIKDNVKLARVEKQITVHTGDRLRVLEKLRDRDERFDFVFLDPPYEEQQVEEDIQLLQTYGLLHDEATIVAEHRSSVELPETIARVCQTHQKTYRDTTVTMYQ
ncbi:16S rRNA (guanine(966)-N(2))-methyltransferase RsmD [Geomicrobium sp. JSM 1781026]|uniref:16S rRNA (guanine(966)-N(2))-methyltransferase RsmD n=1 Tax=Geomicrobium sp. JSM 1781026 TaxID=3344580 RepID=UPI0035BEB984